MTYCLYSCKWNIRRGLVREPNLNTCKYHRSTVTLSAWRLSKGAFQSLCCFEMFFYLSYLCRFSCTILLWIGRCVFASRLVLTAIWHREVVLLLAFQSNCARLQPLGQSEGERRYLSISAWNNQPGQVAICPLELLSGWILLHLFYIWIRLITIRHCISFQSR